MNIKEFLKKILIFKRNITNETLLGFLLTAIIFGISYLLSIFINKSTLMTILVRDVLMVLGVTLFCLWYIQYKNYKLEDFGLTWKNWYIFLPVNFLLAAILLFLFISEHPGAMLYFNAKTFSLISFIMISGIFEMVVFYSFLRKIFEDAFGIIPGIVLAAIAYILHHTGDQPEFGKLFFVGILYASVFRMGNSILLDYPFFWGIGACFDVLLISKEVREIVYPCQRSIMILILFIIGLIFIFKKQKN